MCVNEISLIDWTVFIKECNKKTNAHKKLKSNLMNVSEWVHGTR